MTTATLERGIDHAVGMGQIVILRGEDTANAVLGSCLGLALFDERKKIGALAHIVLPASTGRVAAPGKFVNTAIEWMLAALAKEGVELRRIAAKMAGGANMFAATGPFQIGQENATAARKQLESLRIAIMAEHLGGSQGRRVYFDPKNASLLVEVAGQTKVVL